MPNCWKFQALAQIIIYFIYSATALVGTNDTSVQELYHQHTAESREVFRKIDELAKHHKVNTHSLSLSLSLVNDNIMKHYISLKQFHFICYIQVSNLLRYMCSFATMISYLICII